MRWLLGLIVMVLDRPIVLPNLPCVQLTLPFVLIALTFAANGLSVVRIA